MGIEMSTETKPQFHKVIESWIRALFRSPFQVMVYSIHVGFVTSVLLSVSAEPFPALFKVLNLVGIMIFPGLVLLQLSSKRQEFPLGTFLAFALVASISYTMLSTGMLLLVADRLAWTKPLSRPILSVWFALSNTILLLTVTVLIDDFTVPLGRVQCQGSLFRISLLGSMIIASGVFGGFVLNNHSNNDFFIIFLILIAVLPLILLYTCPSKHYPLILWSIGIALLLGHNLSYNYLGFGKEFSRVLFVMSDLSYSLGTPFPRELNLHLALLYPALAQIGDVPLLYVFKYLHPIIISAIPVLFYHTFSAEYNTTISFLSVYYVMSLHLFYYMLNSNTRTGIAVLFLATIVYIVYSDLRRDKGLRLVLLLSVIGLSFSHWGTANLFLLANLGILFLLGVLSLIDFRRWGFRTCVRNTTPILFLSVVLIVGRAFLGNPDIGLLLISTGAEIGTSFTQFNIFSSQTDAAVALTRQRSTTTSVVRILYLLSFIFIPIGFIRSRMEEFVELRVEVDRIVYESFFLLLLAASAAPFFEGFDARRIYIIAAVFLAPLCISGILSIFDLAKSKLAILPRGKSIGMVFIITMLLFSSGVSSVLLTHDRSPNPIVNKESILHDGSPRELYSLLNRELTTTDDFSSTWTGTYRSTNSNVYLAGSPFPTYFNIHTSHLVEHKYLRRPPAAAGTEDIKLEGYIHTGNYERYSGRMIVERGVQRDWGFFLRTQYQLTRLRLSSKDRIYSNGPNKVYGSE